jgi:ABC-2 type transport system permease protein
MSGTGLMLRQVRYTNRSFWRNPASAFFTFVFPLMFLVIFTALLGGGTTTIGGIAYDNATYYVASMAAFGVIQACYTNVGISLVFTREEGVLKRVRGTPLPSWAYLGNRLLHAMLVAFLLVVITIAFGTVVYHAHLPGGADLGKFIATLIVGAGCFAALGLAVSGNVPNADAGPPIINAIMLPLLFLSGIFIPIGDGAPGWVTFIGNVFPVKHFFEAMFTSFLGAAGFEWKDVGIVAIWMVVGIVIAVRTFRWEPGR